MLIDKCELEKKYNLWKEGRKTKSALKKISASYFCTNVTEPHAK